MPISVRGACRRGPVATARRRQGGFTLIEMMVVVLIIGIAAGTIGLNAFGQTGRALRNDAQRLAQLFTLAQTEARTGAAAIVWQADGEGYRFVRRPSSPLFLGQVHAAAQAQVDQFEGDEQLRPRLWEAGNVQVSVQPPGDPVFTSEWLAPPLRIELDDTHLRLAIVRDAGGRYSVEQP